MIFYGYTCAATIEKIIIAGNKKVSQDTIFFYMKSSEKGIYSETLLREDFKVLWNTGFFEDIVVDVSDGKQGKIVKFILKENLLIKSITYKTGKKIKEKDIIEKLQRVTVLHHGRVEQAAFVVLKEPDVPSLLLETGFITNAREELQLRDPAYQRSLAYAVMQGIKKYYETSPPPGTYLAKLKKR